MYREPHRWTPGVRAKRAYTRMTAAATDMASGGASGEPPSLLSHCAQQKPLRESANDTLSSSVLLLELQSAVIVSPHF